MLVVVDGVNTNVELSARNIKGVKVLRAEGANVYDIIVITSYSIHYTKLYELDADY